MHCNGDQTTFAFNVSCIPETGSVLTSKPTRPTTGYRPGDSSMQLSEIMVVTSSVIDRLAIKFTLCTKLNLANKVHFISSMDEIRDTIEKVAQDTENQYGFAMMLLDV